MRREVTMRTACTMLAAGVLACGAWSSAARSAEPARAAWDPALSRAIDAQVETALKKANLAPVGRAEPADLVRRIHLDVLGRIPTAEETQAFLGDANPDRHHALIDRLLADPEMAAGWRVVLHQWLNGTLAEPPFGSDDFLAYVEEALRENRSWSRIATELLVPDPADAKQRGAAYYLGSRLQGGDRSAQLDAVTTSVASVLFGVQLQCAKCHDHPFVTGWKQENYYGLTAFLGRTETARGDNGMVLKEKAEGEVKFVAKGAGERTAALLFLDGRTVEEPPASKNPAEAYEKGTGGLPDRPKFSRRRALVETAIASDSPYFKRALVNRLWKHLLGRGLVEPVDQIHAANPASHPELLDLLADDFATHGYDLRRLLAGLLHSETYLRSSRWTAAGPRPADATYAAAVVRPLTPEQLAASIYQATGQTETLRAKYVREAAREPEKNKKPLGEITPAVLRGLVGKDREFAELVRRFRSDGESFEAHASQALYLTYNPSMQVLLRPQGTTLAAKLAGTKDDAELVRTAFETILSRPPDDPELQAATAFLADPTLQRPEACRELVWSLLTTAEFRFQR